MATKEVLTDNATQNDAVSNQHLDNVPENGTIYSHPDKLSRQGTVFYSYHDSDSDLPDYELRSMSSFLGVDLDKSDADSWDWTFHDENISDLDIKKVPETAKAVKLLANISEALQCENVETESDPLHKLQQGDSMKCLRSSSIDQNNTKKFNDIGCSRTGIFQGNSETGTQTNETQIAFLQKEQNEHLTTRNSHRRRVLVTSSLLPRTFDTSHIQSNTTANDVAGVDDDVVYVEDGKSSKVLKLRLQYLSDSCHVGEKHRKSAANKLEKNNKHKTSHRVRFFTRPSEATQFEKRNTKNKLTKLTDTEARFMYSSDHIKNNVDMRTRPSQDRHISSSISLPNSEYLLPPISDKRFRSFLAKRNSLNDILASRITSWRLNRGWAMSRTDVLVKRPLKEEAVKDNVGSAGSRRRQSGNGDAGLHRFRHFVRIVLILLKAVGMRREKREDTNYNFLSWTVVYDEVLGISRLNYDSGALTFDPLLFKANRESTLSQDIKDILRLPPEHRTEGHIRAAMISFNNVIPAFSEYPKRIQQSMIKVCMYEKFEPGRVIIRQGHRAENFYFIIGGCAVVTQMDSEAGHVHTTNVLGKGNSFGELAFLHMSKRSATVTCRDDVELLCIEREDFINIFMRPRKGDEPDHITFLKSVDILQGWPVSQLPHANPKICAFTFVRRDVILCHDSAKSDWIFVVYSGSCKVLKALYDGPVAVQDGKTLSADIHKVNLAPNSTNFSKVYNAPTSAGNNGNITMDRQHQQLCGSNRVRKYGVSLPAIRSSRTLADGLANRHDADASFPHIDHLTDINNIFNRKHVLPTILGDNQTDPENIHETCARKVSSVKSLSQKAKPLFKPKRQSYGLQPPALSQVVIPPDVTSQQRQQPLRKMAFVEIARLEPGDVFGLEDVVLSGIRNVASCSLVSEGSEVVLISKSFFRKHLTEDTVKRMRQLIQPLPSEKVLQKRFQNKKLWDVYKSHTLARHAFGRRGHGAASQS